jgi:pectin methylesterase-like acyl-CoA thioesterase
MLFHIFSALALACAALALSPPSLRTTPPSGAKIVRAGTTTSGEYATLAAAVAALPADTSSQVIFMYPGTYTGQVLIQRSGPVTVSVLCMHPTVYLGMAYKFSPADLGCRYTATRRSRARTRPTK